MDKQLDPSSDKERNQPGQAPVRPARVLIADDESRIRMALRACLEADGYEVYEAVDGYEALDVIIDRAPDVMLLDLAMPNLDGIRTLKELEPMHGQLKPEIVVLTAWGSDAAVLKTIGLGACAFLDKPISPQVLRAAVRAALQQRAMSADSGVPVDWAERYAHME